MVEQHSNVQYSNDDLTIDRLETEPLGPAIVDLFDYLDDDSSPIAQLKALVLSIDWEITDEVLRDFNEELASLRDIWGGDPVKTVYLQALEKISKYIYRTRSDAHPDAIKLLPILFVDLEKIVQGGRRMSEDAKKQLLSEDVRRFNHLKVQVQERHHGQFAVAHEKPARVAGKAMDDASGHDGVMAINRLKALILSIDWEITEKDLMALRREVLHLEDIFASSRPKQLFLQGIGTLSAYIRNKKSNAHADAFSLLHDFFAGLEKVITERLDFPREKAVLLPLVARFNIFKETIATTLSVEAIAKSKQAVLEEEAKEEEEAAPLQPAFTDLPDDVHGFCLEEEVLSPDVPQAVVSDIEKFFTEEDGLPLANVAVETGSRGAANDTDNLSDQSVADPMAVAPEVALRGINVETEADDDSEEAALPRQGGQLAPALSDEPVLPYGETGETGRPFLAESEIPEEISSRLDDFFAMPIVPAPVPGSMGEMRDADFVVSSDVALQGVNVESDTDDDEAEEDESLSIASHVHDGNEEEPAPALVDADALELVLDEGEEEVEFSVDSETAPALSFLRDDEPKTSEYAELSEIAPALSGFDSELPERSEFAEDGEKDEAVLSLENEELLAFFAEPSPKHEEEKAPAPEVVEKPETQAIDEATLLEVPQRLNDEQRDDFAAFLVEDENPAEMLMPAETMDREEVADIAFLSDDGDLPLEIEPVADASAGQDISSFDEAEVFVDDFFAGKTDEPPVAIAESAVEPNRIPGVDTDDDDGLVAVRSSDEIFGIDIDDENGSVAVRGSDEILSVDIDDDDGLVAVRSSDEIPGINTDDDDGLVAVRSSDEIFSVDTDNENGPVAIRSSAEIPGINTDDDDGLVAIRSFDERLSVDIDGGLVVARSSDEVPTVDVGDDDGLVAIRSSDEILNVDIDDGPVAAQSSDEILNVDIDDDSLAMGLPDDAQLLENSTPASYGDISLHDCVDALSDEINDDILERSYREVRRLRSELGHQPLAEVYLQFISTIMQHIDQRRADASDEAFTLLRQMFAHFEDSQYGAEAEKISQSLVDDTQAVLSWQQSLLQENSSAGRLWL